jgi:hypothetical protein
MGIGDEVGKTVTSLADTMKGTPVLVAFLLTIAGFLGFVVYDRNRGEARETAQLELISKLVTDIRDCRQGIQPRQ